MRPDPDAIEASRPGDREVAMLAAEVRRLQAVIASEPTLTDEERKFLQALHGAYQEMANQTGTVNAAAQADSRKNAATLRGLLERMG